ncbi:hypothetical protein [Kingella negevensis]|uniref:hypothetical protein n=1 Tax=Kingella negevensis TaxID=1522312 RepID=UPI0006933FDA|nr:hypothetical protein [Kingella negevensis]
MSEIHREDVQETATISDNTSFIFPALAENYAKIATSIALGVGMLYAETAHATDTLITRTLPTTQESAHISDQASSQIHISPKWQDRLHIRDSLISLIHAHATDTLYIHDQIQYHAPNQPNDTIHISEHWQSQNHVHHTSQDSAQAQDHIQLLHTAAIAETTHANDTTQTQHRAQQSTQETAHISDQITLLSNSSTNTPTDTAHVQDNIHSQSHQHTTITETASISDSLPTEQTQANSQIWTAHIDNWAMSRYSSLPFQQLAVINGELWGIAPDGLYKPSQNETISGCLKTGQTDLSGSPLVHPIAAYLEYENSEGSKTTLSVHTTQSGTEQTHTYRLAQETANQLTNGRFIFGRGLRGRHFSFTLNITGKTAHINDLKIDLNSTKRRI